MSDERIYELSDEEQIRKYGGVVGRSHSSGEKFGAREGRHPMTDVTRKCSECNGPVYLFGPEHVCVAPAPTASARLLTCELCQQECDSRIGITIRGPMVCKSCFKLHGKKSWSELLEAYASSQSEKLAGVGQQAAEEIYAESNELMWQERAYSVARIAELIDRVIAGRVKP